MKNNRYFLNTLLAAVLFVALLAAMIIRVTAPAVVIPPLNIPNLVLLSLLALLAEHFIAPGNPRCYICIPVFSAVSFGVLPLMAGFTCLHEFWKLGLAGCVIFTVTTFLFTSMTQRLHTGPKARCAVMAGAFGIYLAAQCFAGIIL